MYGSLLKVWRQIRAERKTKKVLRNEEDYLIRGESTQVLRWSLALVLAVAYVARIFFFTEGYFLLTFVLGVYYLEKLNGYLFPQYPERVHVTLASDLAHVIHYKPDGKVLNCEPRISALLRHKLSSVEFDSLVNRILEFKFWFSTTQLIILAFVLTFLPFLKCSLFGPKMLLLWIASNGWEYVKLLKKAPVPI